VKPALAADVVTLQFVAGARIVPLFISQFDS